MSFIKLNKRYLAAFEDKDMPEIGTVGVKFIRKEESVPHGIKFTSETKTWCQAVRAASGGEPVLINPENIGCPAGAISLGLTSPENEEPLPGKRPYTELMKKPAPPADFSEGLVYACRGAEKMEYSLFGELDAGRYKTLDAAKNAISNMIFIRDDSITAVLAFPASVDLIPDVVILPLTPVQAMRTVQAYAFEEGKRAWIDFTGIRAVCSELTAIPYVEQRLNGSLFCLGARVIAGWEGGITAFGMPYDIFEYIVKGMEDSRTGFPFKQYPR